ncbi:MAG TPA: pyridoxine 5'-phosphate synthase [Vicingus sp.]|nr:pyridoxine 5'-phosphate synthase [Flavobacteriales bacterium]HRN40839.1 pyridoxine 5'-phosphate synthase [Vicingus sp.]
MTKLSVNINKVATIRNARGGNTPNLVQVAIDCEKFGAQGITIHPRPDERHIRYADVYDLKKVVTTEFNIEGFPDTKFINLVLDIKPEQVTLVPDPPGVLTSNAGWDTLKQKDFLKEVIAEFKAQNIRTSIFVDTNIVNIENAIQTGTDRIELYTGPYAEHFSNNNAAAIKDYVEAANLANKLKLGINAGHDLSLENLTYFKQHINGLLEVSIGHALISDALYYGLEETIKKYLFCLK